MKNLKKRLSEMKDIEVNLRKVLQEFQGKPINDQLKSDMIVAVNSELLSLTKKYAPKVARRGDIRVNVLHNPESNKISLMPADLWSLCVMNGFFPHFNKVPEFGSIMDPQSGFTFSLDENGAISVDIPEVMKIRDDDKVLIQYKSGGKPFIKTVASIKKRFTSHPTAHRKDFFDLLRYEGGAENDWAVYKLLKHPNNQND